MSIVSGVLARMWAAVLLFAFFAAGARAAVPTPSPAPTPAAVARLVEMQQRGTPDYAAMEAPLRQLTRQQSPRLQARLQRMGKLQSLALVRSNGDEQVYELWFDHGRMLWGVTMSAAGRFARVRMVLREHR